MWQHVSMAGGGWSKRGSGVPLAERTRVGQELEDEACPARHCWVAGAADDRGVKRPGLLVEWRQVGSSWQGRVVYAAALRPHDWVLVEEWVPAEQLTPL